jgi:hypothetical protein
VHAIDGAEAECAQASEQRIAVGEQAVKPVVCGHIRKILTLAPTLIATKRAGVARIVARSDGVEEYLGERACIHEAEIDAESCERVHAVRRVADQHDSILRVGRGMLPAQRKFRTPARECDRAEGRLNASVRCAANASARLRRG